jgi:TIR domain
VKPNPVTDRSASERDFFVSYSQADRAWAEWITRLLEEYGHRGAASAWTWLWAPTGLPEWMRGYSVRHRSSQCSRRRICCRCTARPSGGPSGRTTRPGWAMFPMIGRLRITCSAAPPLPRVAHVSKERVPGRRSASAQARALRWFQQSQLARTGGAEGQEPGACASGAILGLTHPFSLLVFWWAVSVVLKFLCGRRTERKALPACNHD